MLKYALSSHYYLLQVNGEQLVWSMNDKEKYKSPFHQKSPQVTSCLNDCTSIEQYKKSVALVKKQLDESGRFEGTGKILQKNADHESLGCEIKVEPQGTGDRIRYNNENVPSNKQSSQKVKFVIETDGNIDKITKDFLDSLGENSNDFNMKVKVGSFKFEISNDS